MLAGGLTAENVEAGIASTSANAVDCASGVEESPGIKSVELVKQFAERARRALQLSKHH